MDVFVRLCDAVCALGVVVFIFGLFVLCRHRMRRHGQDAPSGSGLRRAGVGLAY